jgi:magnesium chelatase subunit D
VSGTFAFSAVVGMDDMRLALVLNAVSPAIGGVLVRGEKGSAKSTTVRALTAVLPPVEVVAGCRFSCDPQAPDPSCPDGPHGPGPGAVTRAARLVELPVGASDDRLTGSLDLERALTEGVQAYDPGLLAAAHRGVLYVDEVNLLHDHLVDLLLDAAALGTSYVEREGVSVRHAARFLLVGTMNPEEGELRPQLLDRFGLTVSAAAPREPSERAEAVRRRLAFDADPASFAARFAGEESALAARIVAARELLPSVELSDPVLRTITSLCAAFEVDGLRADLVMARTAAAHAAWRAAGDRSMSGHITIDDEDIRVAARLALPHRRRRNPFDAPEVDEQQLDEALKQASADANSDPDPEPEPDPTDPGGGSSRAEAGNGTPHSGPASATQQPTAPGTPFRAKLLQLPTVGTEIGAAGRRSRAASAIGRITQAQRPTGKLTRLHLAATLLAAAPHQRARGHHAGPGWQLRRDDLRQARVEGREGNLVLFVVDASGSMAARSRMSAVTGAVLSLLLDAYQRRDKVGLVTFRGDAAEVALPPTSSVEAGAARIAALPTGGRTPLAAGLLRAAEVLRVEKLRDPRRRPLLVLLTDGRATSADLGRPAGRQAPTTEATALRPLEAAYRAASELHGVAAVVVDCESGPVRLGLAVTLGEALNAVTIQLGDLNATALADTVRAYREVA